MTDQEFSRIVRVDRLPRGGLEENITATREELAALAKINNLPEIAKLAAHVRIAKSGRGVRVEGDLSARVTQTCVVTLEPFEVEIEEPFDIKFAPVEKGAATPESLADPDAPDELVDGRIDLGAIVSEFLTLSLDPYPRKPGVAFESSEESPETNSPFARLSALPPREEPD